MNKKKFILLALLLLCAYFYELFGGMPATVPFAPQPVKSRYFAAAGSVRQPPSLQRYGQKTGSTGFYQRDYTAARTS